MRLKVFGLVGSMLEQRQIGVILILLLPVTESLLIGILREAIFSRLLATTENGAGVEAILLIEKAKSG
jgi:hypothetical protein